MALKSVHWGGRHPCVTAHTHSKQCHLSNAHISFHKRPTISPLFPLRSGYLPLSSSHIFLFLPQNCHFTPSILKLVFSNFMNCSPFQRWQDALLPWGCSLRQCVSRGRSRWLWVGHTWIWSPASPLNRWMGPVNLATPLLLHMKWE